MKKLAILLCFSGIFLMACSKDRCTAEFKGYICLADYNPVCGCDGLTYANMCSLEWAGVDLVHTGSCQ